MLLLAVGALALVFSLAGCTRTNNSRVQGYAEGEFVYVACPSASALEKLSVARGTWVKAGDPLFVLDSRPEKAARDEAEQRLNQARANWEDAKKGRRPTELESIQAQLQQARAALVLSEAELDRQVKLGKANSGTPEELDRARAARDQDLQKTLQLEADLKTANLGSRTDQVAAAAADVAARRAALARAEWDLSQKRQSAPQAGLVFDTLYREGEWVPAGRPVVALLPPSNMKVRAFVSQARVGAIQPGQKVRVFIDGVAEPYIGEVAFISPQAEYTPPVIYSQESREKLVFMIEIRFDPETAAKLHPGQPVDVEIVQ
jgi:HlyD family secretion protein